MHDVKRGIPSNVFGKVVSGSRVLAITIVFMMISTAFVTLLVSGTDTPPAVWTSKDEYAPGETVYIYGEGFVKWVDVTISLEHPDFAAPKTFTETPDYYGKFVCDSYLADMVSFDTPVNVTVTQVLADSTLVATTQFWDPAVYLEGYTLRPFPRFTHGNVAYYNEGDSVPMIAVLSKKHIGVDTVTVEVGFDFINHSAGTDPLLGIDFLTEYWEDPPGAPFNTYMNSSAPFKAEGGTIDYQERLDNIEDAGGHKTIQVWSFTFTFDEGSDVGIVRFGAHLAVSNIASNIYGASFYPGAALHVRLVQVYPDTADEGNRDVPIMVDTTLIPPKMNLEKRCVPYEVVKDDVMTFTIEWSNTGQAAASCLILQDDFPWVLDLIPGSFRYWTSANPIPSTVYPWVQDRHFQYNISYWPGTGADDMNPVIFGYLSFQATVNTDEEGTYYNWANLSYTDDHGGLFPLEDAWCEFVIRGAPNVTIVKEGPEFAHAGDDITYSYTVTNSGPVRLKYVNVTDDVLGLVMSDTSFDVGETRTYTKTYEDIPDSEPLENTATVVGTDYYRRVVTDTDDWCVDILHPIIVVTKETAEPCAGIGDDVIYYINVSNPSPDTDLHDVVVSDPLLGTWHFDDLPWSAMEPIVETLEVTAAHLDPLRNTVTATGYDDLEYKVEDTASVEVDIFHPDISVEKGADKSCAIVGEEVIFWINVTNPSTDTPMLVTVDDPKLFDEPIQIGWLTPYCPTDDGWYWNESFVYEIKDGDSDPFVNTVTVTACDPQDHYLTETASFKVDIYHPMIEFTKEADRTCTMVGETVTYWLNVTNPSTDTPMVVTIEDPMFDGVVWQGRLENGSSHSVEKTFLVVDPDRDPLYNKATVTSKDPQDHYVNVSREWTIDVLHPGIEVDKWASKGCVEIGEELTFYIDVKNPSEDTVMNVTVDDPMFGGVIWEGQLGPTATKLITRYYVASAADGDPILNKVWVNATDRQDHSAKAYDEVSIEVYHPAIDIVKFANMPCAAVGDVVKYTIVVSNPSEDTVMSAVVTDPLFPGFVWSGDIDPMTEVTIREAALDYTVKENDPDPLINTATVRAEDLQGHVRWANASWRIDVVHPFVEITKKANLTCAAVGETVNYTINVTNPAWTDVMINGTAYDDVIGWSKDFTNLAPGESIEWYVIVPMPDLDEFKNTARVVAHDHQEHEVTASASVRVDVVHPDIELTKRANLTCAAVGEKVLYNITVSVPASADVWMNGTVYDDMLGWSASFTDLKPGESKSWDIDYTVSDNDPDPLINTAIVYAYDHQEHECVATASWRLDVVHPGIMIEKTADKACAEIGEQVNYTVVVSVPEWVDVWMNGTVYDSFDGETWTVLFEFENVRVGVPATFEYSHIVTEDDSDPMVNYVRVEAYDHQEHLEVARDSWTVDVYHPGIEVTKTAPEACAHVGDIIVFTITIYVPEWVDVPMNGTVYDDELGWVESFFDVTHGLSVSWPVEYLVTDDTLDPFTNTVYVRAYDPQLHLREDWDSFTTDILHPGISVTKTGPEEAYVGETITYTVTVKNTGDTPLFDVELNDTLVGIIKVCDELGVGEERVVHYDYTVPAGLGTLDNTVVANGTDKQRVEVEDEDSWSVYKFGLVYGKKSADLDKDGIFDYGDDPTLNNWWIQLNGTLDAGGYDNRTMLTSGEGDYQFTGLRPGVYVVSEIMQAGWVNVTPMSYSLVVGSGSVFSRSFGNMPTGNITGHKWLDSDLDGVWDPTESTIPDWEINLVGKDLSGAIVDLTVFTDVAGYYAFIGLMPGLYTVSEKLKDGWYATTMVDIIVDVSALEPFEVTDVDFGNVQYGSINGYKFLDLNLNGVKDSCDGIAEPTIPGWLIELTGVLANGTSFGPIYQLTGANGCYNFTGLLPGVYVVREEVPAGWHHVTPSEYEFTVITGSNITCGKFGNVQYGSIDGWKFLDWDMDGSKDGDEPGIPGWAMTLTGTLNDVHDTPIVPITVYTNAQGEWVFPNLLPGKYTVTEETRPNWHNTTPVSKDYEIWSATFVHEEKFGNVPYTCLYGNKYEDVNANGVWDPEEPGLSGWTIVVEGVRNDKVPVRIEIVTGEDGYWETCYNILPGVYRVYEELEDKEGWIAITAAEYAVAMDMTMQPTRIEYLFGNFELGKIFGWKYEDVDGDGQYDDSIDRSVPGWTITLTGPMSGSTTTDADGYYEFTGLVYGTYTVTEETRTDWVPKSSTSYTTLVVSGSVIELPIFLNVHLSKIWGYKFEDVNSNGVWDPDEPVIANWTIYMVWNGIKTPLSTKTDSKGYYEFTGLYPDERYLVWEELRAHWTPTTGIDRIFPVESGSNIHVDDFGNFHNAFIWVFKYEDVNSNEVFDDGDNVIPGWNITVYGPGIPGGMVTVVTGADGKAFVEVTEAGMYTVEEETKDGWCAITPPVVEVFVLSNYTSIELVEFGNFRCVTITIFKYEDVNSNGVFDNDDEPLIDWEFNLTTKTGGYKKVKTDINGLAYVTFCSADVWLIEEVLLSGWCVINPASGNYTVAVKSGHAFCPDLKKEMYNYTFGNFECVEILVFKYWDKCSNGWYDPDFGDEPLGDWFFTLYAPTGEPLYSGYTNESGYLSFTICHAGVYLLVETIQEGWSCVYPAGGYGEIEIQSGDSQILAAFANYLDVDVPIFKYEDVDSNGIYEDGIDNPLPNWFFELIRDDGTVYSGWTDGNGELVLTVNRSGLYLLREENQPGWTHINPATGIAWLPITSDTVVPVQMFGNFRDVEIIVFKYEDVDSDARYNSEVDNPLPGWSFTVTGPWLGSGTVIVTNGTGHASIIVNRSGWYTITEEDRAGWTHTTDSVVDVYVESGYLLKEILFGNFEDVEITVFKYEDVNSNEQYDQGIDEPLENWWIYLYNYWTGTYLAQQTDGTGHTTFIVDEAGDWDIWEEYREGWCVITPMYGYYMTYIYSGDTFETFEFGNFECVWIDVFKYEDVNSNGRYDIGIDEPVDDWHFELLDATGQVVDDDWTDGTGHVYFHVCTAGVWTVVEQKEQGVTPINPACGWLTVETWSGAEPETLEFGNFWDVWIVVFKYEDVNSNGQYDLDVDEPCGGWEFTISGPGVTNAVAVTDGYGYATFIVNRSGEYTVTEEDREDWTHVNPSSGEKTVTVSSGCWPETLEFGNFHNVRIIVFKFDDVLADGRYNSELDSPLSGWYFELFLYDGGEWVLVDSGLTNTTGHVEFVVTEAGHYMVKEQSKEGWKWILPSYGYLDFWVTSGMDDIELSFANFKLGKISGYKWNDLNGNGEWDEGEPGLSGWKIWIECINGPYYWLQFNYTDASGYYEFTGLPSGHYEIWEVKQTGWVNTTSTLVEVDIIGHTEKQVDFFNFALGCLEGYKYEDVNGNGVYDEGVDEPIEDWTIHLAITTGVIETPEGPISAIMLIDSTSTDDDGYYRFCGLGPGLYVVSEESRSGWTHTNDSSETVLMLSGATLRIHDFLNFELGSITGYKFEDVNSNGVWDPGEPARGGWEVRLYDGFPGYKVNYTDSNGMFTFDGLMADTYFLYEVLKPGWINTTPIDAIVTIQSGDDYELDPFGNFKLVYLDLFKYEDVDGDGFYDSGDEVIGGWEFTISGPCFVPSLVVETDEYGHAYVTISKAGSYLITEEEREGWTPVNPEDGEMTLEVESGSVFTELRFGNFMPGQITGCKFYDSNLSGLREDGEIGLGGWIIWINGTLVGGGYLNFTRVTASDGSYSVSGLPAGTYIVSERLEYAPAGWVPQTPTSVTVGIKSNTAGTATFGNVVFGVIEGYKFYDKDLDGYMESGEPGMSGWTIVLNGTTDQGLPVDRTTVTNASGQYKFEDVQPGSYKVTELPKVDWAPTLPLPVIVDISGTMVYFDIWVNIGNMKYATVWGYKFLDSYSDVYPYWPDGIFDEENEQGLGNWRITLQGWTILGEYVDLETFTENVDKDKIGFYSFSGLLPGTYWVNETMLYGYAATRPISCQIVIYPYYPIPVDPLQVLRRIDFGNLLPSLDPEIPFVLNKGWNLWSSPLVMNEPFHASDLAAAIGPTCLKVSTMDPVTKKYTSFVVGFSRVGSDYDFEVKTGVGYFVVVSDDTYFTLIGDLKATSTVEIAPSWNIIGFDQLAPMKASELVSRVSGCLVYKVSYLDENGKYHSYLPAFNKPGSVYDFTLTEGRAYFLVTNGPGTLVFG